jgi:DUF1365 family protein
MTTNSALFVGVVIHRRLRPRRHYLRHSAFWMLLDLEELSGACGCFRAVVSMP